MQTLRMKKGVLDRFLGSLMKDLDLYAPIKTDEVRFSSVEKAKDVYLDNMSLFPAKEYFFRKREVVFNFTGNKITIPKPKVAKRAFFGLRKCDLNAIKHQDLVYSGDADDPYYNAARKNSYLIGYHCNPPPSKYCFCGSMDLVDFFDLMFYEKDDYFYIEIGSDKGRELAKKYSKYFSEARALTLQERKIHGADKLLKDDISGLYDNPKWKKGVDDCLSCSACTALCPTCYCFEMKDELKTPDSGERVRGWSSCQLPSFTRVAGDFVFRKEREHRFKHRIYHQLDYFKKKYGIHLCVGCGRCIEGCPTKIDFVQIINEM